MSISGTYWLGNWGCCLKAPQYSFAAELGPTVPVVAQTRCGTALTAALRVRGKSCQLRGAAYQPPAQERGMYGLLVPKAKDKIGLEDQGWVFTQLVVRHNVVVKHTVGILNTR